MHRPDTGQSQPIKNNTSLPEDPNSAKEKEAPIASVEQLLIVLLKGKDVAPLNPYSHARQYPEFRSTSID